MTVANNHHCRCPSCQSDERLDVIAHVWVRLMPDGTDADEAGDNSHDWDNHSRASCRACDWSGTVEELRYAYEANKEGDGDAD